jgi:rSAM/selenodomain-associated transferase 1
VETETVIFLMAKQPQPGKTKTRLCPPMTFDQAALLYEALLKDSIAMVGDLHQVHFAVAVSPLEAMPYFRQITPDGTLLLPVAGASIGVCLQRAFEEVFERGYRKAMALNTDGPSLPVEYLVQAIRLLDSADVVLGPGEDGGYYLIGMKQPHPKLFSGIPWSTDAVLSQTAAAVEQLGLRLHRTPTWYDVDLPSDVLRLHRELATLPPESLRHTRAFFQQVSPECWRL